MGALYQLRFPNGKSYIGITVKTAEHRFLQHARAKGRGCYAVTRAIRKYGAANVTVQTLVVADDYGYLKAIERRAISTFGTLRPHGYNLTAGGDGIAGFTFSEQSRAKMAASGKTRPPISDATRAKLRASVRGRRYSVTIKHSVETVAARTPRGLIRPPSAANTSGARGVHWHNGASKWAATAKIRRVMYHLGLFVEKDDAIAARKVFVDAYLADGTILPIKRGKAGRPRRTPS